MLVAEAGTGTGKTFAYLVPALLAGGKVIVSTGTKTLQDQLFDRDLPAVREALATGASAALLKGRANYVCLYRLRRAAARGPLRQRARTACSCADRALRRASRTTGDRADLADVPEDAPVWAHATSTRDNCLGQACPDYSDCFVMRARKQRARGRRGGGQPPSVLRRRGAARRGHLRAAAGVQHGDLRRGAPAARDRAPVLRRDRVERAAGRARARRARRAARARAAPRPSSTRSRNRCEKAARDLRLAFGERAGAPGLEAGAARCPGFADGLRRSCSGACASSRKPLEAQAERSEGLALPARAAPATAQRRARAA